MGGSGPGESGGCGGGVRARFLFAPRSPPPAVPPGTIAVPWALGLLLGWAGRLVGGAGRSQGCLGVGASGEGLISRPSSQSQVMSDPQQQPKIMAKVPGEVRALPRTRCPLCTELFLAPKILPCLHTFCLPCLEQLEPFSVLGFQGDCSSDSSSDRSCLLRDLPQPLLSILCPVCDTEVDLPPGGIQELTTDYLALNEVLLETLQAQGHGVVCDLCVDGEAAKRCHTCKANLCHFCSQAHR